MCLCCSPEYIGLLGLIFHLRRKYEQLKLLFKSTSFWSPPDPTHCYSWHPLLLCENLFINYDEILPHNIHHLSIGKLCSALTSTSTWARASLNVYPLHPPPQPPPPMTHDTHGHDGDSPDMSWNIISVHNKHFLFPWHVFKLNNIKDMISPPCPSCRASHCPWAWWRQSRHVLEHHIGP